MDSNELRDFVSRPAREELAGKIRRLRLRLKEAETVDPSKIDSSDLQGLEVGILHALSDAFGFGTVTYRQFSAAGEFGVHHNSNAIDVGAVRNAQRRAVALLRRAVQTKEEEFEDKYPDHAPHNWAAESAGASDRFGQEPVASDKLDVGRINNFVLDGGRPTFSATAHPRSADTRLPQNARDPRIAMAGLGQAGAMIAGFSGDRDHASSGIDVQVNENAIFGFSEAVGAPLGAYDLLMARVAVLEAALSVPKPAIEKPIGLGHNGPPDFDPPMSEEEIQTLVNVFRGQLSTNGDNVPKLLELTKSAEAKAEQFRKRVDDFTNAAIKGAGGEIGKKLIQVPWWMSVYAALSGVLEAAAAWVTSLLI